MEQVNKSIKIIYLNFWNNLREEYIKPNTTTKILDLINTVISPIFRMDIEMGVRNTINRKH